jgi:hypothetical protein
MRKGKDARLCSSTRSAFCHLVGPEQFFFGEAGQNVISHLTSDTIFSIKANMNSAHKKTLSAIFAEPPPRTLEWSRIESLLIAVGCEVIEGAGSRVGFKRGDLRADFHRPHPGKEAKPYQVRTAREFLEQLEVKP